MTKNERILAGIGLGLAALALLPPSARSALFDVGTKLLTQARAAALAARKDEEWIDIDVSEWTVH